MKTLNLKSAILASATALTLTAMAVPAHADIEDWLRRNFSTRDFVGDWLRDTFGGYQNNGSGFDSPDINLKGYKEAVEIMTKWPTPQPQLATEHAAVQKKAQSSVLSKKAEGTAMAQKAAPVAAPNRIERAAVNQVCDGEKLLQVILETKSPEKTKALCFVKAK
ncbi:hypothetical protein [Celeribacter baekdonensis]|uniref:hypothetical protein n=1 Tax=Celeribacter baekdonensis TaxID=875171 RepID=UPI003A95510E